jgi:hypothetical protein
MTPLPSSGPSHDPDFTTPDATPQGTQRRLQALAARAWSPQAIQDHTQIPAHLIHAITTTGNAVPPPVARSIARAYNQLWDRDPPQTTPAQRQAARDTRERAELQGWPPPQAWDDDHIDNPGAQPAPDWKPHPRTTRKTRDLIEDAEFLRHNDDYRQATIPQLATRLGVTRASLEKAYSRTRPRTAESNEAEAG